jgi:hypothetical protein
MTAVRLPNRLLLQLGQHPDGLGELQDFPLAQLVDLLVQQLYLELRLHVDPVVVLRGLAIDVLLPVLAHHDDWRGVGRLERKREIEKNEGVGVPAPDRAHQVGGYPDDQDGALDDDEAPRGRLGAPPTGMAPTAGGCHPQVDRINSGLRNDRLKIFLVTSRQKQH